MVRFPKCFERVCNSQKHHKPSCGLHVANMWWMYGLDWVWVKMCACVCVVMAGLRSWGAGWFCPSFSEVWRETVIFTLFLQSLLLSWWTRCPLYFPSPFSVAYCAFNLFPFSLLLLSLSNKFTIISTWMFGCSGIQYAGCWSRVQVVVLKSQFYCGFRCSQSCCFVAWVCVCSCVCVSCLYMWRL